MAEQRPTPCERSLPRETLEELTQARDVGSLSAGKLRRLVREDVPTDYRPDGVYRIDPRNGDRIVYNAARARRPHDNRPDEGQPPLPEERDAPCILCEGKTTGIIDVAELSEGFTFINKNLYPVVYPLEDEGDVTGLHFLQWTSSCHTLDWHNMRPGDRTIAMERLAALEGALLDYAKSVLPPSPTNPTGAPGFVSVLKNYGHLVGGSLAHGHQQIILSNVAPRRLLDDWRFARERGESFAAYLLRENPAELLVRDYGPAALLVPYFMRRPYDAFLVLKRTEVAYLHHMTREELEAVAQGWHDALRAIRAIMPRIGREVAYNVVAHNGPGAGLYFEFLPYTQETGGAEHLGLFICQGDPRPAAQVLRDEMRE